MTFDSIINRGEYFSDHYLDTMLQASLKTLRARWDETEGRGDPTPRTRLRGMSRSFSAARARAAESGEDDLGGVALGADMAALRHEGMETRIFRT